LKKASYSFVYIIFGFLIGGLCVAYVPVQAQSSVLASGKWYKVAIEKNGVYKISSAAFKKMGFDLSKTDPRNIRVYGNEGGMLPQANATTRPVDLTENAIFVSGEGDGVFNAADYILFYAQGANKISFNADKEIFAYEKNLYADKNFYFITVAETAGKRITTAPEVPGALPVVNQFENVSVHETDSYNELKSGREWFGERFDLTTELTFDLSLKNVVPGSTLKLVSGVMAQSFSGSSFTVSVNGIPVLDQYIIPINNAAYTQKGNVRSDTVIFSANDVSAGNKSTQKITYKYVKAATGRSVGFLNYALLQATEKLMLTGQQTSFRSLASVENPASTFEIEGAQSSATVWNVTNPYDAILQPSTFTSGKASFNAITSVLKEFVVFTPDCPTPELVGIVENQNLHALATPAFVMVTHPDFEVEAQRLATYRTGKNIATTVVRIDKIYNEFSSGRQDVTAIRDFIKSLHDKSPGTLKGVLIFGKGSYDYKNRVVDNKNFVPTYESRNSLHPLLSYSSDDYYGFLENHEGTWSEDPVVNHTMDIGVGRLPVKSVAESRIVVDKIIRYESDPNLRGSWQKNIAFIADDGDNNLHQEDANELAEMVETYEGGFSVAKIYVDQFPQIARPGGEISPETNAAIQQAFDRGSLVINYTGHGGPRLLADERIFDDLTIERLENKYLPLLVTATCGFGRMDDPIIISGAELCILRNGGGAIGLVSTTRDVNASTNLLVNRAFYDALFLKENNQYLSLGEIFRRTKNNSTSGVGNRNFSLIGDPALTLALPANNIVVTNIQTSTGSTTLKSLSTVTVTGEVHDEAGIAEDFHGVLEAELFDKQTSFQTRGNQNSPYAYTQWYNRLFRGQASVENGVFEFQFVVPKNIAYQVAEGKLSLYARDSAQYTEAMGYSKDFQIGLSENNVTPNTTAPTIKLFMGDTTFIAGGITNPNTPFVARLFDDQGINISGYGIGNSITAVLDDDQTFILNDYYITDINDFTKGTVTFPFKNLAPGKHTITLQVWDTHNNPAQATLLFYVSDGEGLAIESFGNYPNPFTTTTTLFFTHNRSGDDLEASLVLYTNTGQVLATHSFMLLTSPYQVDLLTLTQGVNFIKNQPAGLYFARLVVRSLTNGSKNEQVTKLMLSN
jgi:hypothetical protein